MKMKLQVDATKMLRSTDKAKLSRNDMEDISQQGTIVITMRQRKEVAVDTRETQSSIATEITKDGADKFITETGPNTPWAPYLEYGTGEYAEKGDGRKGGWFYVDRKGQWHFTLGMHPQPFVRPSVDKNPMGIITPIINEFKRKMASKWQV